MLTDTNYNQEKVCIMLLHSLESKIGSITWEQIKINTGRLK